MIKVHFYNWESKVIDAREELDINGEIDIVLEREIKGLYFEGTDSECDFENSEIYWFKAENEEKAAEAVETFLRSVMKPESRVTMKISIEEW